MEIKLNNQTQPDDKTCVCTSIAIILNVPAQVIIDRYHKKYIAADWSLRNILDDLGVEFKSFDTADRGGMDNAETGYYLVSVPSLNFVGGMHQVVAEIDNDKSLFVIHDPQAGTGKKYYVARTNGDPNAVELSSGYTLEVLVKTEVADNFKLKF